MAQVSGLITNIDANGRVQLPLAIRYGLDLCSGDRVAIDHLGDGTIILKKIQDDTNLEIKESNRTRAKSGVTG